MANLLTFSQQIAIKKISQNNSVIFDQLCLEVESVELTKLLGYSLLQDLQANPATVDNAKLLNGCTFTDVYGNTATQKGIRFILAYFNFSKYIGESFIQDTMTGMVQKTRQDSERISNGDIVRLQQDARTIALTAWELVEQFLIQNSTLYPKWNIGQKLNPYTPKLSGLKKTGRTINIDWNTRTIIN